MIPLLEKDHLGVQRGQYEIKAQLGVLKQGGSSRFPVQADDVEVSEAQAPLLI